MITFQKNRCVQITVYFLPWDSSPFFHHHLEASKHLTSKSKFRDAFRACSWWCNLPSTRIEVLWIPSWEDQSPLSKYLNLGYCLHIPDIFWYYTNSYLYISNLHIHMRGQRPPVPYFPWKTVFFNDVQTSIYIFSHWENKKKQKKQNCKTHVGTSWWVRVCNFVFFCFFGFLAVFNTFGQKPKKHWENQKNKIARPM